MPNIEIELNLDGLYRIYAIQGHPLGKNVRGRKKWIKKTLVKILIDAVKRAREENDQRTVTL